MYSNIYIGWTDELEITLINFVELVCYVQITVIYFIYLFIFLMVLFLCSISKNADDKALESCDH